MNGLRAGALALAFGTLTAAAAVAQPTKDFGKPLTLSQKTPISSILKDPRAYSGKRVQVEGLIVEVC